MKLGKLVNPAFQLAFKKLTTQELPLRAAFFIKGVSRQVQEELTKYDSSRMEALKRFGSIKETGELDTDESGNVKLSDENMKKFMEELQSLLEIDVIVNSIKIEDLGFKIQLTAAEASALEELLVE
jgi:hypothetical protein